VSAVAFPQTYAEARRGFRAAASNNGWSLETIPTGEVGPSGEDLSIDVASDGDSDAARLLIVSSGLHGVEGPFGSAVQVGAMDRWRAVSPQAGDVRAVFVHALNPYGFAWSRRTDGQNVDPNRNLLHPDEPYVSDSTAYRRFDALLNPRRPPSAWDFFVLRMVIAIARHGRPTLKQALVTGQYDFPRGLFFGGSGPTVTCRVLSEHAEQWVGPARLVLHLDLHTGLGQFGTHKLLVDADLSAVDLDLLRGTFGAETVEGGDPDRTSYRARGHFGHWTTRFATPKRRYLYACAEFGTHGNLAMLSALRAENQAHHWARPDEPCTMQTKARLREMFCPSSPVWRRRALDGGLSLIERGATALVRAPLDP
jgi:hypothetical protein